MLKNKKNFFNTHIHTNCCKQSSKKNNDEISDLTKDQRNANEQWSKLIDPADKCCKTGTYLQYWQSRSWKMFSGKNFGTMFPKL